MTTWTIPEEGAGGQSDGLSESSATARQIDLAVHRGRPPHWIKSTQGRYLFATPEYSAMLGAGAQNLVGQCDRDILPYELAAANERLDRDVCSSKNELVGVCLMLAANGDTLGRRCLRWPVFDGDKLIGVMGQIAGEPQRETWAEREKTLIGSVGRVAHELRSPLAGIFSMARFMASQPGWTEAQRKQLSTMTSCAAHLLGVVNDMVDVGLLFSGQESVADSPVNVRELVEDVAAWARPSIGSRPVNLQAAVGDMKDSYLLDGRRLRQLLLNLLANATRHTNSGRIEIYAEEREPGLSLDVQGTRSLYFSITDTGIGMEPGRLSQLFGGQRELAPDRSDGGSRPGGFGILVCRHLANALGGRIRAFSTVGVGTSVHFELPIL